MCTVCGCGDPSRQHHAHDLPHEHSRAPHHHHRGDAGNGHSHHHFGFGAAGVSVAGFEQDRLVRIEKDILSKNDLYADANRRWLAERGLLALNLLSSPGAGKTTLLVESLERLHGSMALGVIEGDQETSNDAERIRATGVQAVQLNTGKGCHLDAHMVGHGLQDLELARGGVVFIENVGNLVCPAAFDLGEAAKVVILSVTEGEDKPLKYPGMFAVADLMVLGKVDLLPYVDFEPERAVEYARRVNPRVQVLTLSARTGEGMQSWLDWLEARRLTASHAGAVQTGERSHA